MRYLTTLYRRLRASFRKQETHNFWAPHSSNKYICVSDMPTERGYFVTSTEPVAPTEKS